MSLWELGAKISPRTVAVIAVHLFGIPERLTEIGQIARDANLILIEDSAQYMPSAGSRKPPKEHMEKPF